MRTGDIRTIKVDGKPLQASYLGKGHYATCWRVGDTVYSFVKEEPETGDFSKEALALWGPDHPQAPQYTRHDSDSECVGVYSCPFYEPLTPKHEGAWKEFRYLAKVNDEEWAAHCGRYHGTQLYQLAGDTARNLLERGGKDGVLSAETIEALQEVYDAGANYGHDVKFEFARRNLKVNADGKLLFLDVLVSPERLHRQRATASRRHVA